MKYRVCISYKKAWRARAFVITIARGTTEESYEQLPIYFYMLEQKNPRTITKIEKDDQNKYMKNKRIF